MACSSPAQPGAGMSFVSVAALRLAIPPNHHSTCHGALLREPAEETTYFSHVFVAAT